MTKIKVTKDKNVKQPIDVACGECKRQTKHSVLSSIDIVGTDKIDEHTLFEWYESYQVIRCGGCETVSFRQTRSNSEDLDLGPDGLVYNVQEDLYPSRTEGRKPIVDHKLLPRNVEGIYVESVKALNSLQPVLTGIGIRAIIETVCSDKSASGKNLGERIDNLVVQGVLTKEGASILHKLRVLGNKSAHEVKPHDEVQLGLAVDVIDHLLQGVYILPRHAKKTFK